MDLSILNGYKICDDKAREQAKAAIDAFNTAAPVINEMGQNVNALIRANVIYDERITKAHEKAVEADDAAFNYNKILSERIDNLEKTVNETPVPDENGVATTIPWQNVTGKPDTFTPSTHGHAWGEITGKPETFNPATHGHAWGEITGKPETFTPSAHTHDYATMNDVTTAINEALANIQNASGVSF